MRSSKNIRFGLSIKDIHRHIPKSSNCSRLQAYLSSRHGCPHPRHSRCATSMLLPVKNTNISIHVNDGPCRRICTSSRMSSKCKTLQCDCQFAILIANCSRLLLLCLLAFSCQLCTSIDNYYLIRRSMSCDSDKLATNRLHVHATAFFIHSYGRMRRKVVASEILDKQRQPLLINHALSQTSVSARQ